MRLDHSFRSVYNFSDRSAKIISQNLSSVEAIGRWTVNESAQFSIKPSKFWPEKAKIDIAIRPYVPRSTGKQSVSLYVNDTHCGKWDFEDHFTLQNIQTIVELSEGDTRTPLRLRLEIEHPTRPKDESDNLDGRALGVLLDSITIEGEFPERSPTPYDQKPDYCFWNRHVSGQDVSDINPVTNPRFTIAETDKVGTAGSCFAQHISRRIVASGFNYFVTEQGLDLEPKERARKQYGVYSARYGNIYTPAQLLQLWEEAFENKKPTLQAMQRADGRFVDPARQQIDPSGYASAGDVISDREIHLEAVRTLMRDLDIFVFTLGLTEAWISKVDGSIISAAPGVVAGNADDENFEFVNFNFDQTSRSLEAFLDRFHVVNPNAKVLLTVSPVPLMATYEDQSVLTSTIYSKSVLRVAAEQAKQKYAWVDYFPSYEIITGPPTGGMYFEDDYRSVKPRGVSHVMRCFLSIDPDKIITSRTIEPRSNIICDEEILAIART